MAKKPTIKLWSTAVGAYQDFEVSIENNEVVATREDEQVKFPGGVTAPELLALADEHNKANEGIKAITQKDIQAAEDLAQANNQLLEDLK